MADEIDRASEREQHDRELALAEARRKKGPDPAWDGALAYCPECDCENTARAMLGYGRCIDCQERAERWGE